MRRVRYQVACSLDGFIAGPNDEFDWIPPEPTFDFAALHAQFDTLLMGRRTWEIVRASGMDFGDRPVVVASRTLRAWDLVDTVEPAILPVLLGEGVPFLASGVARRKLKLVAHRAYPAGMVLLEYEVEGRSPERQE